MFKLAHMTGSTAFAGAGTPMLPAAVGLGYLKQPLRYLTSEDIKTMGNRTLQKPSSHLVNDIPMTPKSKLGSTVASVFGRNRNSQF
jgi:hypothetical protein